MAVTWVTMSTSFSIIKLHNPSPSFSSIPKSVKPVRSKKSGSAFMALNSGFLNLKSSGGAGVLERPNFDQSQFDPVTQVEQGGDVGKVKQKRGTGSGDSYKVLLVDDDRHTENLAVKVIPITVPSVTSDGARQLFHESREKGVAVVIITVKEHAEFYSQMLLRGGLRSTIEPESSST